MSPPYPAAPPAVDAPRVSPEEATTVLHAVVARQARDAGLRVLSIKGPFLAEQGLRAPDRVPVDVDVLVAPADFDALVARLAAVGWHTEGISTSPRLYPTHSATLRHALWPVEIDLHRLFPGFLREAEVVFEELWAGRQEHSWCHQQVATPAPEAHLLLAGLHLLRQPGNLAGPGSLGELVELVEQRTDVADLRGAAVELAARVGALRTAAPLLQALGHKGPVVCEELPELALGWDRRSVSSAADGTPWLLAVAEASGRDRLMLVARAVWPEAAELRRATVLCLQALGIPTGAAPSGEDPAAATG